MKLRIKKSILKKHLSKLSKAIVASSWVPALEGILMTVNEGSIQMLASNGTLSIKEVIPKSNEIEIIEPGTKLVPGRLFVNVIEEQEEDINIEVIGKNMTISSVGTKTEVNLLEEEDYPVISFETFGKNLAIDVNLLRSMIKNVSYAAASDDQRLILNGVNLKARDGKITATATNSYRLATETNMIDSDIEFDITVLSKNIKDFIPANAKGEVIINVEDSKIITSIDSTVVSSKLIEGDYLQTEKLLTNEFASTLNISIKELEKNINKATVLSSEGKKIVKFVVDSEKVFIESKKEEKGQSSSQITGINFNGEPIEIIFDSLFLREAISRLEGNAQIKFNGPFKPFIVTGESNKNLIQLILPHRSF